MYMEQKGEICAQDCQSMTGFPRLPKATGSQCSSIFRVFLETRFSSPSSSYVRVGAFGFGASEWWGLQSGEGNPNFIFPAFARDLTARASIQCVMCIYIYYIINIYIYICCIFIWQVASQNGVMFIFELVKNVRFKRFQEFKSPTSNVSWSHRQCHRMSQRFLLWFRLGLGLAGFGHRPHFFGGDCRGTSSTKASKSWLDDSWWANDFASFSWYMMVYGSLVDVR